VLSKECKLCEFECMSFWKNMNNTNYSIQNTFLNKMTTNNNKCYLWSWKQTILLLWDHNYTTKVFINALKWLLYYHGIAFAKQMYIQNVIKHWHWDSYWFEFVTKEYKCGSHGYRAYNQIIGFRVKYSFHPNAWYSHW
jgi:hypothetical protein